jgi:hypothetical protein
MIDEVFVEDIVARLLRFDQTNDDGGEMVVDAMARIIAKVMTQIAPNDPEGQSAAMTLGKILPKIFALIGAIEKQRRQDCL